MSRPDCRFKAVESGPLVLEDSNEGPSLVLEHLVLNVELASDDLIVGSAGHSVVAAFHDVLGSDRHFVWQWLSDGFGLTVSPLVVVGRS